MSGGQGRSGRSGAARTRPQSARADRFGALRFCVAVSGAAIAIAACGGTDFRHDPGASPPTAAAPTSRAPHAAVSHAALQAKVVRAVTRTRAARRARTSISVTFTGLGADTLANGAFDVAGSGVADLVGGDADLTLSVPLFDRLGGGGTVEQRIVSGILYTKLPAALLRKAKLPPPVQWLSLDPRASGADRSALAQSQVDPAGELAFLGAASADVRAAGTESVRGVPTAHDVLSIDPARLTANDPNQAAARARVHQLGSVLAGRPLFVDVWLDAAGRARRVVVSFPLAARGDPATTGPEAMMRVQSDFYAFGVPVKVVAPAANEVLPYRALDLRSPS